VQGPPDAQRSGGHRPRERIRLYAFQGFAGISTLDIGFDGEDDGDQYHSIYDDFYWYTHFIDTDSVYGRALAQIGGTAIMRLADADLIAYYYPPQAASAPLCRASLRCGGSP
jgi:hypothetical protein